MFIFIYVAGVDFAGENVTITFPVGSGPGDRQCGLIAIIDDNLMEGMESFTVIGTGGSFAQDTLIVSILGDYVIPNPFLNFIHLVVTVKSFLSQHL